MNDDLPFPPRRRLARPSAALRQRMDRLFSESAAAVPASTARLVRWPVLAAPLAIAAAVLVFVRRDPPPAPGTTPPVPAEVILLTEEQGHALLPSPDSAFHYDLSVGSY